MKEYDEIILHVAGENWWQYNLAYIGAKCHIKINKWQMVGYHFGISNGWMAPDDYQPYFDGYVMFGRSEKHQGAHCKGHNKNTIGILIQAESAETMTHKQGEGLISLLDYQYLRYGKKPIKQHSDYDEEKPYCAGFTPSEMDSLNLRYN